VRWRVGLATEKPASLVVGAGFRAMADGGYRQLRLLLLPLLRSFFSTKRPSASRGCWLALRLRTALVEELLREVVLLELVLASVDLEVLREVEFDEFELDEFDEFEDFFVFIIQSF